MFGEICRTTNKKGLRPTITVDRRPFLLIFLVGARGFEPPTPRSRTECSTRLSHAPTGERYLTSASFSKDSAFNRRQRVMRRQIGMQRRHRHVAVADRLIVRPIVRLPLVLPFLDPVVRPPLRIVPLGHRRHVIALRLHGHAIALRLPFRHVDVEKRPRRQRPPRASLRRSSRPPAPKARSHSRRASPSARQPARQSRAAPLRARPPPSRNTSRRRRGSSLC